MTVYSLLRKVRLVIMRCFLSCFGFSSSSKRPSHAVNAAEDEEALEVNAPVHNITAVQESIESKIEKEEESCNKAVVKLTDEVTNSIEKTEEVKKTESERDKHEEEECSESLFSLSLGSAGKPVSAAEPEVTSPMLQVPPISCTRKDVPKQLQHQVGEGEQSEKEAKAENTTKVVEEVEQPNLKEEKVEATLMNHLVPEYRYQDCSEEEYDDTDLYDDDDDNDDEPSSESLFSLSTDGYRKQNSSAENEKEVSSSMLIQCIPQVSSVLNPIENVSDVNVLRVRKPTVVEPSLKEDKENINLVDQLEPSSGLKMMKAMWVDSSFSSWLVESKESTPSSKSKYSHEDRPILKALTAEEINKYSSTASSRKSRSLATPADTPIMGTGVGSNYWTHTRHNKSKSRMNANPNWSSTSFRTSLEPAFQATLKTKKETRVDSSFSSRLVESENPPPSKPRYSHEDKPILAEEISMSKSPVTPNYANTPIMGTDFGSNYWTHTMHKKSKSRMSEEQIWNSTSSVRTRLEPAFEATL